MSTLSVAFGFIPLVGAAIPAVLAALVSFDAFVANFVAILAILGALDQIPGFSNLLGGGASVLSQIGTAIGDFVASIISAIGGGVADMLEKVGDGLSKFTKKADPFFKSMANLDPNVMTGVKNLAQMMLILTASDILNSIASFFGFGGNSLSKFGDELKLFGPSIKKFADDVKDINPAHVVGAASAAKIMAEVEANLPKQGGLKEKIFGSNSLEEFANELVLFGPAIKDFGLMVKDVNPEQVEGAASAAKIMSEVAENLPTADGLVQKIFGGNKTLKDFGEELKAFGPSIVSFTDTVKDVDPNSIEAVKTITEIMTKLADDLPSSNEGLTKVFFGDNSISAFGGKLAEFGQKFMDF